eukprot:2835433-Alexandrium_andersonii.AAC.1
MVCWCASVLVCVLCAGVLVCGCAVVLLCCCEVELVLFARTGTIACVRACVRVRVCARVVRFFFVCVREL